MMKDNAVVSYINSHREEFISDLKQLVDIPSVRTDAEEGMPFGKDCARVMKKAEELVAAHGFSSVNYGNYALECDLGNAPELMLLAHLDVVPAGEGWTRQPFCMTVENGLAYGRGTTDDKGAALACLYAMKAVRAVYGEPSRGVRLVLGSGEETGSEDMGHYFSVRPALAYTLSPDADYPLINLEKGRYAPVYRARTGPSETVVSIAGGDTANIVPGKARAVLKNVTARQLEKIFSAVSAETGASFEYDFSEGSCFVTCSGVSAHAASPEKGNNANTALTTALIRLTKENGDALHNALVSLSSVLPHGDVYGASAGVAMSDKVSGALTLNHGILSYDGVTLTAGVDIRCPVCGNEINVKDVLDGVMSAHGFMPDGEPSMRPVHYVPEDSAIVREALSVYETYTGRSGGCLSIGGGTYVHDIDGGVAFGIEFPGRDYRIHGADEYAYIDELLMTASMYAQIIKDLTY